MDYTCLGCGAAHGEPTDDATENWYWRVVEHGRIGPFCSGQCSKTFQFPSQPTFSLDEWERLHFLKWRILNDPPVGSQFDNSQIAR